MARLPRLDLPNHYQHIIQRGNNRQAIFFERQDYLTYLSYLREAAAKNGCRICAYVLMTNHVHLLAVGDRAGAISGMMQALGRRYVRYANKTHLRTGTLFEGRFKSCIIDTEAYLLTCMRYIELNPVRASLASYPDRYPWSSYGHHSGANPVEWLDEPDEYRRLGLTETSRRQAYQDLFNVPLAPKDIESIRMHLNKNCVLGRESFQNQIENALKRRVRVVSQGRPRKQD